MLANYITLLRMLGTIGLPFLKPLSAPFFALYFFCGATDVLDGFVARKTRTTSEIGAKLDSIADLIFYTVLLILMLPDLWVMLWRWLWFWIGFILFLRLLCYIIGFLKNGKLATPHTILNKATGFLIFLVPCFLRENVICIYAVITAVIATAAVVYEISLYLKPEKNKAEK